MASCKSLLSSGLATIHLLPSKIYIFIFSILDGPSNINMPVIFFETINFDNKYFFDFSKKRINLSFVSLLSIILS